MLNRYIFYCFSSIVYKIILNKTMGNVKKTIIIDI
nr:MAG TPA: hypothetical protein [Caudoviricetes sp.]DAT13173.1 MAG TPA: hypothetical protein [Caudoviricetes sp.]DAY44398.1 MAG TPA: hypothetical protein [Caudoviricetes sp.]